MPDREMDGVQYTTGDSMPSFENTGDCHGPVYVLPRLTIGQP